MSKNIEAFTRNFTQSELLRDGFLFAVFNDGRLYCKFCDSYITGSREAHFEGHKRELVDRFAEKALRASESRSAGQKRRRQRERHLKVVSDHGPGCDCEICTEVF